MNEEFVPYPEALELKEIGFNKSCLAYWFNEHPENPEGQCIVYYKKPWDNKKILNGVIREYSLAPTFSQAFRWFREKHNLHAEPYTADMGAIEYSFQIRDLFSEKYIYDNFNGAGASYTGTFNTPEEAELECLRELIKLVKNK